MEMLLEYLIAWMNALQGIFKFGPGESPIPKYTEVLSWLTLLLDGFFPTLVLTENYHPILQRLRDALQTEVVLCGELARLRGILDQLRIKKEENSLYRIEVFQW